MDSENPELISPDPVSPVLAGQPASPTPTVDGPFASVLVIGVGLIGGSMAAALKDIVADARPFVRGIDVDASTVRRALEQGWLDEGGTPDDERVDRWLDDAVTDLVVLAMPARGAEDWFARIGASGYRGAVTDVASTKGVIVEAAERSLPEPGRYLPGHPMAGSEVNGIEGARANLFQGAHWILCPDADTRPEVFTRVHELVTSLGARSISLPRTGHDDAVAIVSHVPHMIASALVQLAGRHASENHEIFRLAAGGFKDTTRVAAGSPELWCGIALDNREALMRGLGELREIVERLEGHVADADERGLGALLSEAASLRRSIPAAWVPDSARLVEVRIPMANRSGVIAEVTGFAGKAGCNIQSIDIDHINEESAILELILTDEGDIGRFSSLLIDGGFDVSLRPLAPSQ